MKRRIKISLEKIDTKRLKEFSNYQHQRAKTYYKGMNSKKKIVFLIILLLIIPTMIGLFTFSRYVIQTARENYLLSKQFFFYSDVLSLNGTSYELSDWDGTTDYAIDVDVKNFVDELRWTKEPIMYEVTTSCDPSISGSVSCTNTTGTINNSQTGGTSNNINISLSNNNNLAFEEGDYVDIDVTVTSTSPYRKSLSATFKINVKENAIKYSIRDNASQKYFDLYLSNSTTNQKSVSLTWDYTLVRVDNSNEYIENSTPRTTTINDVTHVNGSTFNIEAKKSIAIRFYKTDTTQNYTYPAGEAVSIIGVN